MTRATHSNFHMVNPHLHTPLSFAYPTVGIPTPGDFFNSTKVKKEDLFEFDSEIAKLFKPYNVQQIIFRIQIANLLELELQPMEATSFVTTFWGMLKQLSI